MDSEFKVLAHDINNQIQVIRILFEDLIDEFFRPGSKKENINATKDKIDSRLSNVSSICRESLNEEGVYVSLEAYVKNVIEYCEDFDDVKVEFLKRKNPLVKIPPMAFERALTNLVKNSVEAKSTSITIELNEKSLCVKDNGGGITNEQLVQIRLGNHSTTKLEGHGIGLGSMMQFCKKVNWNIEMSNYDCLQERNKRGFKVLITF